MAEKHSVISTTRMASFANKEQPSPLYWQREVSCVPFSIHHPSNKSAKNLDMCGICVNTHTFSPDVSRASIYLIIIYMQGRELFIREFSALFCCFLLHLGGEKMKNVSVILSDCEESRHPAEERCFTAFSMTTKNSLTIPH